MGFVHKKSSLGFVFFTFAVFVFFQNTAFGWSDKKTAIWKGGTGYWLQRHKWELNYRWARTPGDGFDVFISKKGRVYLDRDKVTIDKLSIGNAGSPGKLTLLPGKQLTADDVILGPVYSSKSGLGEIVVFDASLKARKTFQVGRSGPGRMVVERGGHVKAPDLMIGSRVGAKGTAIVRGLGSQLKVKEYLKIGNRGEGMLKITNHGYVNSRFLQCGIGSKSQGTIIVTGSQSQSETDYLDIGVAGNGILTITEGGCVKVNNYFIAGYINPSASGTINVSGKNSVLSVSDSWIGFKGHGSLDITDRGRFDTGWLFLGWEPGSRSSVSVSGQGSRLKSGDTRIGLAGQADLTVNAGGLMTTGSFIVGQNEGSSGEVRVLDKGSLLITGDTYIGNYGDATVSIEDGGSMCSGEFVIGSRYGEATGHVTVFGRESRLETQDMVISSSPHTVGNLNIVNGGAVISSELTSGRKYYSTGYINISGPGSMLDTQRSVIGSHGYGSLSITDGGLMKTGEFIVAERIIKDNYGRKFPSSGTVTVSGTDSRLQTDSACIGVAGVGIVDITDGGSAHLTELAVGKYSGASGTLTVSGENSLLSSKQVALGVEGGDAAVSVTDGGALNVEAVFEMGGNGALKVSDGGRLTMAPGGFFNISSPGATAVFTDTAPFDGHVHVNGTLSAPAAVFSSGSRLTGSQGVIRGDVTLHGTLSPGGADDPSSIPATLFIDGNYTQEKDSRYVAGIDFDTQVSDRVEVSGSTTLKGGTIEAAWTGHVTGEKRFTVLTSGSIDGDFDTLAGDTALVKVAVEKTPDSVGLIFTRTDYADVTVNPKAPATQASQKIQESQATQDTRNLPKVLDDLSRKPGKDMYQVLSTLDRMTDPDQVLSAYDQMTPSVVAGALAVNLDTLRQIGDLTGRRAASLRSELPHPSDSSLYIHPISSVSYRGGDHDHPAYRAGTAGIVTGIEKRSGSFFTGARGIYASSNIRWKDPGRSSSRADMASVGFYGGYLSDTWDLYASVDTGGLFYDTRRRMVFGGINRTASASPDGRLFAAQLGGSLDVDLGRSLLRPWASLRYARLTRNDYTEKGAGDLNLTVGETAVDSLRSTLGLTLSAGAFRLPGTRVKTTPALHAAWYHEFMGQNRFDMVSQLAGGGHPFPTTEAIRDADLFGFGPGMDLDITDTVSGNIRYEGILGDTSMNHNIYAGISVRF